MKTMNKLTTVLAVAGLGKVAAGSLEFEPLDLQVEVTLDPEVSETVSVDQLNASCIVLDNLGNNEDVIGSELLGDLRDKQGNPILMGSEKIFGKPDGQSILHDAANEKHWLVTHYEGPQPGQVVLSELERDENCRITVKQIIKVDSSEMEGIWSPCAASTTPWGTHFGSEEYEPDAKYVEDVLNSNSTTFDEDYDKVPEMMRYYGFCDPNPEYTCDSGRAPTVADYREHFRAYRYGFPWELTITDFETGAYSLKKHHALGRISRELSVVAPDGKTVYSADDGTNVGFYRFIADAEQDFSAGKLQCIRATTTDGAVEGGEFSFEWLTIATTADAEADIASQIDSISFYDMFEVAEFNETSRTCAGEGFTATQTKTEYTEEVECLKIKQGMENIAGFLETRRACALAGGTTEYRKWEGLTYDADNNVFYTAMTRINNGMLENDEEMDKVTGDHVKVKNRNLCGCIYKLPATKTADTDYSLDTMVPFTCGKWDEEAYNQDRETEECDPNAVANPDGVVWAKHRNAILVAEDTGRHQLDYLWSFDTATGEGTVIGMVPSDGEAAGIVEFPPTSNDDTCYNLIFSSQEPDAPARSGRYSMSTDTSVTCAVAPETDSPEGGPVTFPPNPNENSASMVGVATPASLFVVAAMYYL